VNPIYFLSSVVGCFSKEVSRAVKENVKKIPSHGISSTLLADQYDFRSFIGLVFYFR